MPVVDLGSGFEISMCTDYSVLFMCTRSTSMCACVLRTCRSFSYGTSSPFSEFWQITRIAPAEDSVQAASRRVPSFFGP